MPCWCTGSNILVKVELGWKNRRAVQGPSLLLASKALLFEYTPTDSQVAVWKFYSLFESYFHTQVPDTLVITLWDIHPKTLHKDAYLKSKESNYEFSAFSATLMYILTLWSWVTGLKVSYGQELRWRMGCVLTKPTAMVRVWSDSVRWQCGHTSPIGQQVIVITWPQNL